MFFALTRAGVGALVALCVAAPTALGAVDYSRVRALSFRGDEALKPQAVVDSQGRTTVAWYGSDGTNIRVKSVRIGADGKPEEVQTLSREGADAGYPRLAVDSQGRVTVVWYVTDSAGSRVEAVQLGADGTPGPVQVLSENDSGFYPQVAVDSTGVATVVWQTEITFNRIQARRIGADGSLGPILTLDDSPFGVRDPRIVIDSADRATVVWSRQDGDPKPSGNFRNGTIQHVRLAADGTPGPVQLLSAPAIDSFYPQAALDSIGRATVVWTTPSAIFSTRVDENGVAGPAALISGQTIPIDPAALDVDSQGRAFVAWFTADNTSLQIVRLGANGIPEVIQSVTPATSTIRSGPALAIDSQDRATVVWPSVDEDGDARVLAARLGADGVLSPISRVSGPGEITEVLDVEIGPGDRASLAWSRDTGRGLLAEFALGGPGTVPPNAQIVDGPDPRSRDKTPTFTFSSDVVAASFAYSLDGARFRPCDPEFTKRTRRGRHTLRVVASDADGTDPTPARRSFKIVRKKR